MGNGITAKLDNLGPMTLDAPVAHSSKRHKLSLTREATLLTFAVLAYFGVRYITQGTTDAAIANANRLLHLESLFALGFEAAVQSWALAQILMCTDDALAGRLFSTSDFFLFPSV